MGFIIPVIDPKYTCLSENLFATRRDISEENVVVDFFTAFAMLFSC